MADGCAATDWFRKTAVYVWRESDLTAAFAAEKRLDLGCMVAARLIALHALAALREGA